MKFLQDFFNWEGFSQGKVFAVTGVSEWKDFKTKEHLGTRVECAIVKDSTVYPQKDNSNESNLYEKITFKVSKDVNPSIQSYVKPIAPVCRIYGNFNDMLRVKCSDIQILQA